MARRNCQILNPFVGLGALVTAADAYYAAAQFARSLLPGSSFGDARAPMPSLTAREGKAVWLH
jgi:hypothetical protein